MYSSLTCLYFLYAFYQSGIKRKLAAFSKSNNNNNENLNKVFMAHLRKSQSAYDGKLNLNELCATIISKKKNFKKVSQMWKQIQSI